MESAFFADNMGSGLHIVDVSDPTNPTLLSQITSANGGFDNTHKIAIWQNFVFIPQNLTAPAHHQGLRRQQSRRARS
jgi:hypothetical protein